MLRREPGAQSASEPDGGEGTGSTLARAAALRFPNLKELQGRERIEALIDHITDTAIVRGDLEQLRLEAHTRLHAALGEMVGVVVGSSKTKTARDDAKRLVRPDLAETIDGTRWLISRCTEQIERLGGTDYDAASRAYTLLGG